MPRVAYPDLMADEKHLWMYVYRFTVIEKKFNLCMININIFNDFVHFYRNTYFNSNIVN